VTATVRPCSGRVSSQASRSRSAATSPTSVIAGARMPVTDPISPNVDSTVFCPGSVPCSTTATGCDAGRPPAISCEAIRGSAFTPM
jgi:hypothetical protein